ncbi:MAG TPA: hypothetical protein VFM14_05765, partial [Gemmatimonadales bacterium]|nr:hypothetical protein [Gemmatimonadales bacterium]
ANRTFFAETTYTISGYVKVTNGAVLTIQPGTRIVGDADVPGSSLWILRGARLIAEGTATQPIVFTSEKAAGSRAPGDWGGILIVGNGIINRTAATVLTEGGAAGEAENYAGGTDNTDNSGSLRYVRIEFAGFDVSGGAGQELNSLSMYAVGSGTRLEYIQTLNGLDDAFEWWGGAVDARYLISTETGDDHFDWTEGYRGRNQFLIGYQSTRFTAGASGAPATDPRGIEADGCDPNPTSAPDCQYVGGSSAPTGMNTPFSGPVIANLTLIGPGTTVAGFPTDGNGVVLRRGTGGRIDRSIVARWPGVGVNGRDWWTDSLRLRDSLSITNAILAENATGDYDAAEAVGTLFTAAKFATANHRTGSTVAQLVTLLPGGTSVGDWRPPAGSPAADVGTAAPIDKLTAQVAGYPYSGGWQTTSFVGAGDANQWWSGWTTYAIN